MLDCFPLRRGPYGSGASFIGGWQVSSWPGNRINPLTGKPGSHGNAVDLIHPNCFGEPMFAVCDGRLVQSIDGSLTTAGGRWSRLERADGFTFGYGHANRYEAVGGVSATNGGIRQVKAGDVIAYVGSTGGSTGPHLHAQPNLGDVVAMLQEAAAAGRFPGVISSPILTPPTEADFMAKTVAFPDGKRYTLAASPESDTGFGWVHIPGPAYLADGVAMDVIVDAQLPLANGVDANDAMFERHPVLSGPDKRPTHS